MTTSSRRILSTRLTVKVVPGASRDEIAGWLEESLKIRVVAPPEKGKANSAVEKLLAGALGLSRRAVRVVSGATSQRKTLEISGLSLDEIRSKLAV
ncbi:MAG TPA: DUF167 domain-containing protein [Deltaproteobacteria bacterium]|nr:DUF167 domain-containing protein [Deltaproteobacteria bacterium]